MSKNPDTLINLKKFKSLTFDVYGTLIDWEPSILAFLEAWASRNGVKASHEELLKAFDDARAHYQQLKPAMLYPEVLKSCYSYICDRWRIQPDRKEQEKFSLTVGDWEPFPDVPESLRYLKQFFKLGALSNIDNHSLSLSMKKMGVEFDVIATAERVGSYKPGLPHFVAGLTDLAGMGILPHENLHIGQSLRADIRPGNLLGLTTAWINRGERTLGLVGLGAELAAPDLRYSKLADLVEAHKNS